MKRYSFWAVVILSIMTACSVKEIDIQDPDSGTIGVVEGKEIEFTATTGETDPETKSTLIQDGELPNGQPKMITWWSPAEEICIFYGASEGNKFTSTNTELVQKATFRGTLSAFTGQNESGEYNYFWAVYPYNAAVSCDGESVVAILANEQEAFAGSYANNTNITIAKSPGLSLGFYNVCSFLRFTVEKEGVIAATFRGNNNEDVAGKFSVSMGTDGKPTAPVVIDGVKEITLRRPNDEPFVVGTSYYFVLLPQTFENGFTVQFDTADETGSRLITVSAPFTRNNINFGNTAFDHNVSYVRTKPANDEIWYTTQDESLYTSYNGGFDFGGALILSNTYENGKGIIKFDRPITKIGSANPGNNEVTSITFPESVITLGRSALSGLTSLQSFTIPSGVECIEAGAISSCSSLTSLFIPDNVLDVEAGAIIGCNNLERFEGKFVSSDPRYIVVNNQIRCFAYGNLQDTDIVIPESITSIGSAFQYSTITSVTLNNTITSLQNDAFYNCRQLTTITCPKKILTAGSYLFERCNKLQQFVGPNASGDGKLFIVNNIVKGFAGAYQDFDIPEGVEGVDWGGYDNVWSLSFPSSMEHIYLSYYNNLNKVTFGLYPPCNTLNIPSTVTVEVPICLVDEYRKRLSALTTIVGKRELMGNDHLYITATNLAGGETLSDSDFDVSERGYFNINDFGANAVSRTLISYYQIDDWYYGDYIISFDGPITHFDNITNYMTSVQADCLVAVWIPETVTEIGDNFYISNDTPTVNFYFCGATPPTMSLYSSLYSDSNINFKVPSESLLLYKTTWSRIANLISGY